MESVALAEGAKIDEQRDQVLRLSISAIVMPRITKAGGSSSSRRVPRTQLANQLIVKDLTKIDPDRLHALEKICVCGSKAFAGVK
jgi:hypothetical protein